MQTRSERFTSLEPRHDVPRGHRASRSDWKFSTPVDRVRSADRRRTRRLGVRDPVTPTVEARRSSGSPRSDSDRIGSAWRALRAWRSGRRRTPGRTLENALHVLIDVAGEVETALILVDIARRSAMAPRARPHRSSTAAGRTARGLIVMRQPRRSAPYASENVEIIARRRRPPDRRSSACSEWTRCRGPPGQPFRTQSSATRSSSTSWSRFGGSKSCANPSARPGRHRRARTPSCSA